MKRANLKIYGGLLLVLFVSGCGSFFGPHKPTAVTKWQTKSTVVQNFDAEGRLAVKVGEKGYYANFLWQNQFPRETIAIKTPLGNTVGTLCSDQEGVIAQSNHQEVHQADNVEDLSRLLLGFVLPLNHLRYWALGQVVPDVAYQVSVDGLLQQEGWQINRKASTGDAIEPVSMELFNAQLNIRLFFDDFNHQEATEKQGNALCAVRNSII